MDPLNLTRQGLNLEEWEKILPAISDFTRFVGRDVVVSNPHGFPAAPEHDDNIFYIRFWSAPSVAERSSLPAAYGFELEKGAEGSACLPSGEGYIIREDSGNPVAELVDNNLYILFDLPHGGSRYAGEIMGKILEETKRVWLLPDRGMSAVSVGSEEEMQNRYIALCGFSLRKEIFSEESRSRSIQSDLQRIEEDLRKNVQLEKSLAEKFSDAFATESAFRERFGKEFDNLLKLRHVKKVSVEGDLIKVFTDEIGITYNGHFFRIGEFEISIPTAGSSSRMPRCRNLTRQLEGTYDHPHVKNDGQCCLGNIEKDVKRLTEGFHFFPLVQLLIKYLGEYNSGNPHARIEKWG